MARVSYLSPLAALVLLAAGCEGTIGDPSSFEDRVGFGSDAGTVPDQGVGEPDFDPFEGGGVTYGVICGPQGPQYRMVFTKGRASCQRHAEILATGTPGGDAAIVEVADPVDGPAQFSAFADVCLNGQCTPRSVAVEIDAYSPAGAIGRWAIPVDGRTAGGSLQATVCAYDAFLPGRDPNLIPNLAITDVAIYQGVKVPLVERRSPASTPLSAVAGRPALLRVFVEPQVGFTQAPVLGQLTWDRGDGTGPRVELERGNAADPSDDGRPVEVAIASREANEGTTFDFNLAAEDLVPGATWSVSLRGTEACGGTRGDTSGARYPSSGSTSLDLEDVGPLKVVLVPFRYNPAGGLLPDTSEAQLERYRKTLLSMFPVTNVEISVREEPVEYDQVITGNAGSWSPYLQRLLQVRAQDNPPPDVYYYGIVTPREGGGWSGTAGLGPLAGAPDVSRRGAVGLGYGGNGSTLTCAHELGHAAGRAHAPCGGAGNPDPTYPYDDGSIGVWGYDILDDVLKDPAVHNDFMGYCSNDWISDFNYLALMQRYAYVNGFASRVVGEPTWWRSLLLRPSGAHHWEDEVAYPEPPYGDETTPVVYLDAEGGPIAEAVAVMTLLDHADDVILFVPAAPEGTAAVDVDGVVVPY